MSGPSKCLLCTRLSSICLCKIPANFFLSQQEKCTNQFMTFWWPCDPLCVIWNLLFCDQLSGEKIKGYNAQRITPCEIVFKISSEKSCSLIGRTHWPFIQVINTVWSCVGVPPLLQQKTGISVFCDPDRSTICSRWRVWKEVIE